MALRIRLTYLALQDIEASAAYYKKEGSATVAERWLNGIEETIRSLREMPHGFAFAPENEDTDFEVRQAHYKSHRVLFTVEGGESVEGILVLRIYHQARKALEPDELGT